MSQYIDNNHIVFVDTRYNSALPDFQLPLIVVQDLSAGESHTFYFHLPPFKYPVSAYVSTICGAPSNSRRVCPIFHPASDEQILHLTMSLDTASTSRDSFHFFIRAAALLRHTSSTNTTHIPWTEWGPHGARLVPRVEHNLQSYDSCGPRFAMTGDQGKTIELLDFHPARVAQARIASLVQENSNAGVFEVVDAPFYLPGQYMADGKPIETSLPYTISRRVLLDDASPAIGQCHLLLTDDAIVCSSVRGPDSFACPNNVADTLSR